MKRTCCNCHRVNTSGKPFLCAECAEKQWGYAPPKVEKPKPILPWVQDLLKKHLELWMCYRCSKAHTKTVFESTDGKCVECAGALDHVKAVA